jgi:hypothetical protein
MLFLGALTVFWPHPPSKVVAHAIQHLAAGILLSAIALELIPTIAAAHQKMSIVGMVVGFSLGAIVMITLPMLLDEGEEGEEHGAETGDHAPGEGTNLMPDQSTAAAEPRGASCDPATVSHHGAHSDVPMVAISTEMSRRQADPEPPSDSESLTFVQVHFSIRCDEVT